jgi:cellulose synthase/poly-beta-1,6-N-acetylglucosamine synthase-like glycosyltransferase
MSLLLLFFYIVLGIASTRLFTRLILSTSYRFRHVPIPDQYPPISIIVPAYNEEVTIQKCLDTLLQLDYPQYDIIVVDDGSTDQTLDLVQSYANPKVKIISQPNQGKAHALNTGIKHVENEFIVTVDADTTLHKDALQHIAKRFSTDLQLGAIAGNVKVDPEPGLLNALQAAEYTLGINLIRKTQSMLGCVMIVPGPIAALRKVAIEQAGYFSEDTFAEDFDITMQILKKGYKIQYEDHA